MTLNAVPLVGLAQYSRYIKALKNAGCTPVFSKPIDVPVVWYYEVLSNHSQDADVHLDAAIHHEVCPLLLAAG